MGTFVASRKHVNLKWTGVTRMNKDVRVPLFKSLTTLKVELKLGPKLWSLLPNALPFIYFYFGGGGR